MSKTPRLIIILRQAQDDIESGIASFDAQMAEYPRAGRSL